MVSHDARFHAADPRPGSNPDLDEVLKSPSMHDLEAKLGSSPDGPTQAEGRKRRKIGKAVALLVNAKSRSLPAQSCLRHGALTSK